MEPGGIIRLISLEAALAVMWMCEPNVVLSPQWKAYKWFASIYFVSLIIRQQNIGFLCYFL